MELNKKQLYGKIAYGFLFCAVLPALGWLWSSITTTEVSLPLPQLRFLPAMLLGCGFLFVSAAMLQLWREGRGLPMNAFPPQQFVATGFYRFFAHPIYIGAVLLAAGCSLLFKNATGFYLLTPLFALACIALVLGYEQQAIRKHFGKSFRPALAAMPAATDAPATFRQRLAVALRVFVPWFCMYEMLIVAHPNSNGFDTMRWLPGEHALPVIAWTVIPYSLTYLFVVLVPFCCTRQNQLRYFFITAHAAVISGLLLQLLLPFYCEARAVSPKGIFENWILAERLYDGAGAAFPSFHVIWAILAAAVFSKIKPALQFVWWVAAFIITASCSTTGIHSIPDCFSGLLVGLFAVNIVPVFRFLQRSSERIANAWSAWQIGPLRIISHAQYSFLAGFTGALIGGVFIGNNGALLFLVVATLAGGALWGQLVEGSSRLLRPFGYYGSILGGGIAWLLLPVLFNVPWMQAGMALALAAPFAQAAGRLRCLVQGCCHGAETHSVPGIRYTHPKSRVCCISGMQGKTVHNTPLYSICSNIIIGLMLLRLWYEHVPQSFIVGMYFILAGLSRFVEEAWRGEIQTRIAGGLRLYQWAALASVSVGIGFTCVPAGAATPAAATFDVVFWGCVAGSGLLSAFAMSMDFPGSDVRFSRLSG